LGIAALLLLAAAALRGAEYDESYTVFLVMGTPRPDWPDGVFTVAQAWGRLDGASGLSGLAHDLRVTDVHPPLYFWMVAGWRAVIGTSLFATRGFSVLCALGALALVGAIARRLGLPALAAMALTLGCYGFAYTGAIARGFALAQLLNLAGIWLLLDGGHGGRRGGLAGLLLGAACLANYLAGFVGAAALAIWLLSKGRAGWPAVAGFAAMGPPALWFFLAQRGSRTGQFPPFDIAPALARLGKYAAGNVFGGLPLYAGAAQGAVSVGLTVALAGLAGLVGWRWRRIGGRWLLGLCAVAPALGLLGLGVVFNTTPIELRYLAFATPFIGLLLAGALPRSLLAAVLAVQALAIGGLITRPETMQPQGAAARAASSLAGPDGLLLVPRGNDGAGLVGSVLLAAPSEMRLLLVVDQDPPSLRAAAHPYPAVILALLPLDEASRAVLPTMRAAFAGQECWRELPAAANLAAYDNLCRE